MYRHRDHNYFVYITTNPGKTVLYIGMTNDIELRLQQHYEARGSNNSFAGKYYAYFLIYFERYPDIQMAIEREKELKKWRRAKKVALIEKVNPKWNTLNPSVWSY